MANWAVTIGINRYNSLHALEYAKQDAERMRSLLKEELRFEQVFLFTEDSEAIQADPMPISTRPTYGTVRQFLNRQFREGKPLLKAGDNLWFFFAGHGQHYGNADYLMLSDSDPDDIENTAISVDYVTKKLRNCGADNVVLFLDACRDRGSGERGGIRTNSYPGVIIFYSCQPTEPSWELGAPINQGSFTHVLMQALRGESNPRCATVAQLDEYLCEQVPRLNVANRKQIQTPATAISPESKRSLILLPRFATNADILRLKFEASRAETERDWDLAWQLWVRVVKVTAAEDAEAIEALRRLKIDAPEQQPLSEPELRTITSSTIKPNSETVVKETTEPQQKQHDATTGKLIHPTGKRSIKTLQSNILNLIPRSLWKRWILFLLFCFSIVAALLIASPSIREFVASHTSPGGTQATPQPTDDQAEKHISYGEKS